MNRDEILSMLRDGLWHTTHPRRYLEILKAGAIVPEPNVPDTDRWKASRGPDYYPLARHLGGISLFDFGNVDLNIYEHTHPSSGWATFVPYRREWAGAIWIRTNVDSGHLISANDLADRWDYEGLWRHTVMPRIEAAHIGAIPTLAFTKVVLVDASGMMDLTQVGLAGAVGLVAQWSDRASAKGCDPSSSLRGVLSQMRPLTESLPEVSDPLPGDVDI